MLNNIKVNLYERREATNLKLCSIMLTMKYYLSFVSILAVMI